MFIGKLNQKTKIDFSVTKRDISAAVEQKLSGNPFRGEPLFIGWRQVYDCGIDLHVSLDKKYFINTAVINLTKSCSGSRFCVCTTDKTPIYTYSAETGKKVSESAIELKIDRELDSFIIEIDPDFSDVGIDSIDLYGADFCGEKIFPSPQKAVFEDERVAVSNFDSVFADSEDGLLAIKVFAEKFEERTGIKLKSQSEGKILLCLDSSVSKNGFRLNITPQKILISASDMRGFVCGCETVIKLINEGSLPVCNIDDAPFADFRGVHLFMPSADQFDFAKRLVKYLLSPLGYNQIILQFSAGMKFDRHPEINAAFENAVAKAHSGEWPEFPHDGICEGKCVEKAQVADFIEYVRSFGIDVIPEVQSLGHVQFMTVAYPEITECAQDGKADKIDARLADVPPSEFYGHTFCPSNPKSYQLLFDILDEIIEVAKPREYVHMGHDEVYQIGICPVCKDRNPAELFAEDINRIHSYLAKRGLKMMIWADMLQPVTNYKTPPAADLIPKDIVMLDFIWYFHLDKDIEENLLAKDFNVIYGNMYSSHFPRYETRIRKSGVLGGQISTWVSTNEECLAREGKLYDMIFTASMLWDSSYTHFARFSYDRIIRELLPQIRSQIQNVRYPSLNENSSCRVLLDNGDFSPKKEYTDAMVQLEFNANSIVFEHTALHKIARIPWIDLDIIGNYEISFCDGTSALVPVTYGGNVGHWDRHQNEPFSDPFYRHNGYTSTWYSDSVETILEGGKTATIYRFEWINPYPEKQISGIKYIKNSTVDTTLAVCKIYAVNQG